MRITLRKIENQSVEPIDYEMIEKAVTKAIVTAAKKQAEQYSITREWMKFVLYPVFWGIAILSGIFALGCFYYGAKSILSIFNTTFDFAALITGMTVFFIGLILIAICMSSYWSAKEIDKEKDRQYVASMFSNMVALVALIVALVALFRG